MSGVEGVIGGMNDDFYGFLSFLFFFFYFGLGAAVIPWVRLGLALGSVRRMII